MKASSTTGRDSAAGTRFPPVIVDPTDAVVRIDLHDLRYRSAHPQGRRARGEAGDDSRPRGSGNRHRRRRSGNHPRRGRPRARLLHQLVRTLPLLQGGSLRPLHGWRRLGVRSPDRRPPGGVRADRLRRRPCTRCRTSSPTSRCSSWPTSFRRHSSAASSTAASSQATCRNRRCRPDRVGRDHDGEAVHAGEDRGDRPRRRPPRQGTRVRRRRRDQQRPRGRPHAHPGAHGWPGR